MLFYYLIFFLIVCFLIISKFRITNQNYLLFFLALILVLISGLKPVGVDLDSRDYVNIFSSIGSPSDYFKDYQYNSVLEPAYYLIPSIINNTLGLNNFWIFLIFAVLSLSFKLLAILKLSDFIFSSLLVFYSHFFILHEMTQIRTGVATGILLLCIVEIQKKRLTRFLLLIVAGLLFHYSIIVFLPFFFLDSKKINKIFYSCLLFVPYLFHFMKIDIITILQTFKLGIISDKIQQYNMLVSLGIFTSINIYNYMFLIQLATCALFIYKSDLLFEKNKYSILLLKIYCIASAAFVLFSNIPVLAFRISELLSIVQIIVIPFLFYIIKPKYFALILIICFALLYISVDLLYLGFLKPYFGNPLTLK